MQLMLLYRIKSWVVMGAMLKVLEGFCNLVARIITVMIAQHMVIGECEWTPVAEVLKTTGLWKIKYYI